jgi:hypothetical protein
MRRHGVPVSASGFGFGPTSSMRQTLMMAEGELEYQRLCIRSQLAIQCALWHILRVTLQVGVNLMMQQLEVRDDLSMTLELGPCDHMTSAYALWFAPLT